MIAKKAKRKASIPWLRIRPQKSGKTYYYLEMPGNARRDEIALGSDYLAALQRRQELLLQFRIESRKEVNDLKFVMVLYREIHIPTFEVQKKKENYFTISQLEAFIAHSNMDLKDLDDPQLHVRYAQWRNARLSIRVKNELAMLRRLKNLALRWLSRNHNMDTEIADSMIQDRA
jgi:hypothetical protein